MTGAITTAAASSHGLPILVDGLAVSLMGCGGSVTSFLMLSLEPSYHATV